MSSDYEYVKDESGVPCFVWLDQTDDEVMTAVRIERDLPDYPQEDIDGDCAAIDDAFQDEWGVRPVEDSEDAWFDIVAVPDDVSEARPPADGISVSLGEQYADRVGAAGRIIRAVLSGH